jgi:hypothetical protein
VLHSRSDTTKEIEILILRPLPLGRLCEEPLILTSLPSW